MVSHQHQLPPLKRLSPDSISHRSGYLPSIPTIPYYTYHTRLECFSGEEEWLSFRIPSLTGRVIFQPYLPYLHSMQCIPTIPGWIDSHDKKNDFPSVFLTTLVGLSSFLPSWAGLLAPQSGALRISAYRDFLPNPSHPIHL